MVGELQIIFLLHAVTIVIGVLRELLILIEQLRRVSAGPVVDTVLLVRVTTLIAVIIASATTAIIVTIIIQGILFPVTTNGGDQYAAGQKYDPVIAAASLQTTIFHLQFARFPFASAPERKRFANVGARPGFDKKP